MGISCKKYVGKSAGAFAKLDNELSNEKKRAYKFEQARVKKLEAKRKQLEIQGGHNYDE